MALVSDRGKEYVCWHLTFITNWRPYLSLEPFLRWCLLLYATSADFVVRWMKWMLMTEYIRNVTYIYSHRGRDSNQKRQKWHCQHCSLSFSKKTKSIHRYIIVISRGLDEKQLRPSLKHWSIRLDGVEGSSLTMLLDRWTSQLLNVALVSVFEMHCFDWLPDVAFYLVAGGGWLAYLQLYIKTASYRTLIFFIALRILTVLEMWK